MLRILVRLEYERKIDPRDKPVLYSHIYSYSSVKSVVHWFQIMDSATDSSLCMRMWTPTQRRFSQVDRAGVCVILPNRGLPRRS